MQYVKYNLDEFRFVLPVSDVVEIIPYVKLSKLPNLPDYFAGLCQYRGSSITVIDLCALIIKKPCHKKLSTRIIVVEVTENSTSNKLIGLMVEKATEIVKEEEDNFMDAGIYGDDLPHVGQVLADSFGVISRIFPEDIFSQIDNKILFQAAKITA
jgi:chemotaxis-related protein WspB